MSRSINRVTLVGNVGKDPEVRFTGSGFAIASFSVACNDRKKDGDQWVDHTEWVPVKALGKTAENVGKYLRKGSKVAVEGKFQTETWKDKQTGENRYRSQVLADDVVFLDSKADRDARAPAASTSAPAQSAPAATTQQEWDDSLPF